MPIVDKDFELPKTDDWSKLISEEYDAILKANEAKKGILNLSLQRKILFYLTVQTNK